MAFEAFCFVISSRINLLFLKSVGAMVVFSENITSRYRLNVCRDVKIFRAL